jgi:acetolactate decarboxylase
MRWFLVFFFATAISFSVQAQQVFTAGAARNVMMGTDLSPHVQLDTLLDHPHLFALGPVEDLQGEITVFDGQAFTATATPSGIITQVSPGIRAPFLVYAYVPRWAAYEMDHHIDGPKALETVIDSLGQAHGYGAEEAFPFRLSGQWDQVDYHIIMRDKTEEQHSHAAHDRAKRRFTLEQVTGDIVGFFSRNHQGVFTHKGQFIHPHFLAADRSTTGHLDGLQHHGRYTVYLPATGNRAPLSVLDTDFSKGKLRHHQLVTLEDLTRFHGHRCDGLAVGFVGLKTALYELFSDSVIDRTSLRAVSKPAPCLVDAATYMTGARYPFNTFYTTRDIPYLFIVQRTDNGQTLGIQLKPGVKPAEIIRLSALAEQRKLSDGDLLALKRLEDRFTDFILRTPPEQLFEVTPLPDFDWQPVLRNDFIKTDVLNK